MAITLNKLAATAHSIKISDGTNDLLIDGSGHLSINDGGNVLSVDDAGGSLTVDAVDFDIRGLNVATDGDHVYITDSTGANALDIDASGYITAKIDGNVSTVPGAFDTWQVGAVTITATATEIAGTPLANRLRIIVQNLGDEDCALGEDNTVTFATGLLLPEESSVELGLGTGADIFAICDTGNSTSVRFAEFAD